MEIQTQANYDYKKNRKVKKWDEKITVPNQTMSMKELIQRHIHGRPMPAMNIKQEVMATSDITFDDINPLEKSPDPLTTRTEMEMELIATKQSLHEKLQKKEKEKKEAELKKQEAEEQKRRNEVKPNSEEAETGKK